MTVIPILAGVLALVATILAFIFIVPDKKREGLNKFGKFLHDVVNFKFLIVEKILQALYIFATSATILTGFFMLFYVQEGYYGYYYSRPSVWYGGYGLLVMIFGPIIIRLVYEFLMMAIILVKNVIQINNKTKSDGNEEANTAFNIPSPVAPAAPVAPATAPGFCIHCGAQKGDGDFCTTCGNKY